MHHKFRKINQISYIKDYILELQFDDGAVRRVDFQPYLIGSLFSPLKSVPEFLKVQLDPEAGTVIWPNGADFDPDWLFEAGVPAPAYNVPLAEPSCVNEPKPE